MTTRSSLSYELVIMIEGSTDRSLENMAEGSLPKTQPAFIGTQSAENYGCCCLDSAVGEV